LPSLSHFRERVIRQKGVKEVFISEDEPPVKTATKSLSCLSLLKRDADTLKAVT
jgi:hypothetical protein